MGITGAATALPAPALATVLSPPPLRASLQVLQRSCDCGNAAGPDGRCDRCNHSIQRRAADAAAAEAQAGAPAPRLVHDALAAPGHALDPATRAALEPVLGGELGGVRIHTGPLADAASRAVNANAFAVGQHVVFRDGQYQPGTTPGRRLLVHELTHTRQQAHARPAGRNLTIGPAHDAHEREAARAAAALPAARPAPVPVQAPAAAVRRQNVQRDTGTAPAGAESANAAPAPAPGLLDRVTGAIGGAIADTAMAALNAISPSLGAIVQQIRAQGIVGFLKSKFSGAFGGLFGGLSQGSAGFIGTLAAGFGQFMATAKTVLAALAHNDCKPLFDALGKLGDTLGGMAGDAWDRLKSFLAPVGDFFTGLWNKFGAPAVDFLSGAAADVWNGIKSIASQIGSAISTIGSAAWGWLKTQLGITDGANDSGGVLGWIQIKLGEAWDAIKTVLDPVIAPMKAFAAKIVAALPLDAILHLRETVHEWLGHAGGMVSALQNPKGVTQNQAALRDRLLPAIKAAIVSLGGKISEAGGWVAAQIGGLLQTATGLFGALKSNAILGAVSGAIDWVGAKITALGDWVQGGVRGLFDVAGQAVSKLSGFVEPLLGVLQKLASVIGNVVKALPGLVMGPVWALIPSCIKDPIKDFIIQHILSEIPIISTFVKIPNIWGKIQKLVLDFLTAMFVDGNLGGAAMMVVRAVLEAAGVDVNLMLRVLAKAISSLDDIMMHPMNFLKNIGGAMVQGFQKFWSNIGHNLFMGLQSWLLGPLAGMGVTPMKDVSLGSIFQLVMQILGITTAKIHAKLVKLLGPKVMGVLDQAWHWLSTLISKGPAGVWEEIKGQLASLGSSIIGGITAWIGGDLVKAGIAKIAKLSNPAGEIIELIQTIAKTIDFVVTKMNKILAMADAVLDSIGNIAKGNLGPAAGAIERALVAAIGTVLSFLAEWLGISDPGEKLKSIVEKVQAQVDKAIDWLIAKAISIVQKLLGKDKKEEDPKWTAAVAAITSEIEIMAKQEGSTGTVASPDAVQTKIPEWKTRYGFSTLTMKQTETQYEIDGSMSPTRPVIVAGKLGSQTNPVDFAWVKPPVSRYPKLVIGKKSFTPNDSRLSSDPDIKDLGLGVTYGKALQIKNNAVIEAGPKVEGNTNKNRIRDKLKDRGWDNSAYDVDHIWEKQIGGPDAEENLWPLDSGTNRASGNNVLQERNRVMDLLKFTSKALGLDKVWLKLKL